MKYNEMLAKIIKDEFDFNDYEISKEKLIEVTAIFEKISKNGGKELTAKFFMELHTGKLGMFYKQPISFLSVAQKYFGANQLAR